MGKIHTFTQDMTNAFDNQRSGASSTVKRKALQIDLIVRDLKRVNVLPFRLHNLKGEDIKKLVAYWQARNQTETIQKKLALLRSIMRVFPTNEELGVINKPKRYAAEYKAFDLSKIKEPLIRDILVCQKNFGLKKFEAIGFHPAMINTENRNIIVPIETAYNQKERVIPIHSVEQADFLQKLHQIYPLGFCQKRDFKNSASLFINAILESVGIYDPENFRYEYLINRHNALRAKKVKTGEILRVLKAELGYVTLRPLRGILSCLDSFLIKP